MGFVNRIVHKCLCHLSGNPYEDDSYGGGDKCSKEGPGGMTYMIDQRESVDMGELEDVLLFKAIDLESLQGVLEDCSVQKLKKGGF